MPETKTGATKARFKVNCRLELASQAQDASVSIDRTNNMVTIRPLNSRKTWVISLDDMVENTVRRIISKEAMEARQRKPRLVKRGLLSIR